VFFVLGIALSAGHPRRRPAEFAALLAEGLVFNAVRAASLSGPYQSFAMNYWYQTLESVLLSPYPYAPW
jgi:hypothetical protein